jgi:hypothetical protein
VVIVLITFLLAYFSWRFIEQPFRDRGKISRKVVLIFSVSGCLIFGAVGASIHFNDGFHSRYNSDQLKLLSFHKYDQRDELYRNRVCFLRGDQDEGSFADICKSGPILIWGDSHAASLSYGMSSFKKISQFTSSGCPPMLNSEILTRPHCQSINQYVFKYINEYKPKAVFLNANWLKYKFTKPLTHTLDALSKQNPTVEFFVLGGLPQWLPSLPSTMLRANLLLDGQENYIENKVFNKVKMKDDSISEIVKKLNQKNVRFISLLHLLCQSNSCLTQTKYPQIEPIAFDYGHLTGSGSIKASSLIFNNANLEQSDV